MKPKIFLAGVLLIAVFCVAGTASAMTDVERQALIAQIQQQIAQLTQQLSQMLAQQQGTGSWCYTFNVNLGFANSGTDEVANLHIALQNEGLSYGPDGIETYSMGTSGAVSQFQAKYGIIPTGFTGILTRAKLNQLYGCENTQASSNQTAGATQNQPVAVNQNQNTNNQQTDLNNQNVNTNQAVQNAQTSVNNNSNCVPSCSGACGADDGCGGTCQTGNCPGGATCSNGQCGCTSYTVYPNAKWSCLWGPCVGGVQSENCILTNIPSGGCYKASTSKPTGTRACGSSDQNNPAPCQPNWFCTSWSACANGQQTCSNFSDSNKCGVATGKPSSTQSCNSALPTVDIKIGLTPGAITDWNGNVISTKPAETQGCSNSDECTSAKILQRCVACGASDSCGGNCQTGSCSGGNTCQNGQCYFQGPTGYTGSASNGFKCTSWSACTNGQQTRSCTTGAYTFNSYDSDGPMNVQPGHGYGLKWNSTNATSCVASGDWSGTKNSNGLEETDISANATSGTNYTYTITCTGPGGTAHDSVSAMITQPITTTISASPPTFSSGGTATLTWSSTGATSCQGIDNWSGTKATSGSETTPQITADPGLDTYKKYTIFCQGPLGTSRASATIVVHGAPVSLLQEIQNQLASISSALNNLISK